MFGCWLLAESKAREGFGRHRRCLQQENSSLSQYSERSNRHTEGIETVRAERAMI